MIKWLLIGLSQSQVFQIFPLDAEEHLDFQDSGLRSKRQHGKWIDFRSVPCLQRLACFSCQCGLILTSFNAAFERSGSWIDLALSVSEETPP